MTNQTPYSQKKTEEAGRPGKARRSHRGGEGVVRSEGLTHAGLSRGTMTLTGQDLLFS